MNDGERRRRQLLLQATYPLLKQNNTFNFNVRRLDVLLGQTDVMVFAMASPGTLFKLAGVTVSDHTRQRRSPW